MTEAKSFQLQRVPAEIRGLSRYRLTTREGEAIAVANEFLDLLAAQGLSERTLRTYGYCLLSLWRWFAAEHKELVELSEAELVDYIAFQRRQELREPAPKSLNLRLTVARSLYRFATSRDLPSGRRFTQRPASLWQNRQRFLPSFGNNATFGNNTVRLSVKVPRRLVVPLKAEEVEAFLRGLHTWRDLSIVGLFLFCGLRSIEVVSARLGDIDLGQAELLVRGKGSKERMVPLASQVLSTVRSYLQIERPKTEHPNLFVCLKGRRRGEPMTLSGLRSLFRTHRLRSRVPRANAHRFRHTFGSDMARAGICLPALMKLMGHSTIHQTLRYVELSPADVRQEFLRVTQKLRNDKVQTGAIENG